MCNREEPRKQEEKRRRGRRKRKKVSTAEERVVWYSLPTHLHDGWDTRVFLGCSSNKVSHAFVPRSSGPSSPAVASLWNNDPGMPEDRGYGPRHDPLRPYFGFFLFFSSALLLPPPLRVHTPAYPSSILDSSRSSPFTASFFRNVFSLNVLPLVFSWAENLYWACIYMYVCVRVYLSGFWNIITVSFWKSVSIGFGDDFWIFISYRIFLRELDSIPFDFSIRFESFAFLRFNCNLRRIIIWEQSKGTFIFHISYFIVKIFVVNLRLTLQTIAIFQTRISILVHSRIWIEKT